MTDLDNESRAAAEALVYRLRNRGEEQGQFATDDELFAAEYVTALKGRGWRPTEARPSPDWKQASGDARVPDARKPGSAEYLALKAAKGWGTGGQPALTEGNDRRDTA